MSAFAESTLRVAIRQLEMARECLDEPVNVVLARRSIDRALGEMHATIQLLELERELGEADTERPKLTVVK